MSLKSVSAGSGSGLRFAGVVPALGAAVLWGTTGTSQALAPSEADHLAVGALRVALGGAVLLAWAWKRSGAAALGASWSRPENVLLLLLGSLGVAAYQACFFASVSATGVAVGTLITLGSAPITTGLVGWMIGERPTLSWALATAVAVAGGALLILDGHDTTATIDITGVALALVASCAYAVYTVATRRLLLRGMPGPIVIAGFFTGGAVLLLPVLFYLPLGWVATTSGLLSIAWLGIAATSIAYLLFVKSLHVLPAATASTLALAEPFTATILSIVLLGESLSVQSAVGAVFIAAGLLTAGLAPIRARAGAG